nr:MAG TPA: hypothetical protein [Bacteriophage sp.]
MWPQKISKKCKIQAPRIYFRGAFRLYCIKFGIIRTFWLVTC